MSLRLRIILALALLSALGAPVVHAAVTAKVPPRYEPAKKLYREFCGQCHALKEALAVGFGSGEKLGPGEHAGPSFDPLRVPWQLSVLAVLGHWDGHDRIMKLMTWDQIYEVACFTQLATRDHQFLAKMPSDEFLTPAGPAGGAKRCSTAPVSGGSNTKPAGTSSASTVHRGSLTAGVSPAGKLTLKFKGKPVVSLKAGRYTITVADASSKSGFTLQRAGKAATPLTELAFVGRKTVTLALARGQWTFYSGAAHKTYFLVEA